MIHKCNKCKQPAFKFILDGKTAKFYCEEHIIGPLLDLYIRDLNRPFEKAKARKGTRPGSYSFY